MTFLPIGMASSEVRRVLTSAAYAEPDWITARRFPGRCMATA